MKFIDLHCDTIAKIVEENLDFAESDKLHVTLPGIISSHTIAQVFACFIMDSGSPDKDFETCNTYIDAIETLMEKHKNRLVPATSFQQIDTVANSRGKTAVIISIEGATPLKGKPELLEHFYKRGVRLLTIAWDDNEFCGTVFGNKGGLTALGEKLIHHCNDLGVIVDVSHASDKAFYDIASITTTPFMASHSNARELCPNDRNLSDDMIRLIAERGGIIGLTYGSGFIQPEYHQHELVYRNKILKGFRDKTISFQDAQKITHKALSKIGDAPLALLVGHARHILNTGGEDCLALGSDFDGVDSLPKTISGVQSLPKLVQEMQQQGISSRIIDKICHKNACRYFKDILKD
jgi:membrane dipeptidase